MKRNVLYAIVGLLVLAVIFGAGLFFGGAATTRRLVPTITAAAMPTQAPLPVTATSPPAAPPSPTVVPTVPLTAAPTSTRTPAANAPPPPLSVEPPTSPTAELTVTLTIHTEPGVDVFVSSARGTFQVGTAITSAEHSFDVGLVPDADNYLVVAVRRTYEPYDGAQKNYDLAGQPLVVVQGNPPPTPLPTPRWTLPPRPSPSPVSDDLQALADYLIALQPSLDQALAIARQDTEIVQASDRAQDDALLCDGRLEADAGQIAAVVAQMQALSAPSDAADIHRLLLESGTAWADALGQIDQFCRTGNQLYKVPAVLKFWEAALKFQEASDRFWALVVAKGLDEWVQR
jgi:hypothetical protein